MCMRTSTLKDLFPRASQWAFPAFLNMGGYPANRGKAGLLQLGREALPAAQVTKSQVQIAVVELCNIVTPLLDRSRRTSYVQARSIGDVSEP